MYTSPRPIPSALLSISDVPEESANWDTIVQFAAKFDRSEEDVMSLSDGDLPFLTTNSPLSLLRAHLFLEWRRWNHRGRPPDAGALLEIRRVIHLIRGKLAAELS